MSVLTKRCFPCTQGRELVAGVKFQLTYFIFQNLHEEHVIGPCHVTASKMQEPNS